MIFLIFFRHFRTQLRASAVWRAGGLTPGPTPWPSFAGGRSARETRRAGRLRPEVGGSRRRRETDFRPCAKAPPKAARRRAFWPLGPAAAQLAAVGGQGDRSASESDPQEARSVKRADVRPCGSRALFQPGPVKPETLARARVARDLGPGQGGALHQKYGSPDISFFASSVSSSGLIPVPSK
jgi:hypothetical protein